MHRPILCICQHVCGVGSHVDLSLCLGKFADFFYQAVGFRVLAKSIVSVVELFCVVSELSG